MRDLSDKQDKVNCPTGPEGGEGGVPINSSPAAAPKSSRYVLIWGVREGGVGFIYYTHKKKNLKSRTPLRSAEAREETDLPRTNKHEPGIFAKESLDKRKSFQYSPNPRGWEQANAKSFVSWHFGLASWDGDGCEISRGGRKKKKGWLGRFFSFVWRGVQFRPLWALQELWRSHHDWNRELQER